MSFGILRHLFASFREDVMAPSRDMRILFDTESHLPVSVDSFGSTSHPARDSFALGVLERVTIANFQPASDKTRNPLNFGSVTDVCYDFESGLPLSTALRTSRRARLAKLTRESSYQKTQAAFHELAAALEKTVKRLKPDLSKAAKAGRKPKERVEEILAMLHPDPINPATFGLFPSAIVPRRSFEEFCNQAIAIDAIDLSSRVLARDMYLFTQSDANKVLCLLDYMLSVMVILEFMKDYARLFTPIFRVRIALPLHEPYSLRFTRFCSGCAEDGIVVFQETVPAWNKTRQRTAKTLASAFSTTVPGTRDNQTSYVTDLCGVIQAEELDGADEPKRKKIYHDFKTRHAKVLTERYRYREDVWDEDQRGHVGA
ncbi:hypothetical protein C8J56DRAFT_885196 [Mycena floridula]|nr:hypothetical protein C8J56DRAFT_885196 [Mycena floridula]